MSGKPNINTSANEIFNVLIDPPYSPLSSEQGPFTFPNPEKQVKDILSHFITNELAKAETSLASTFSQSGNQPPLEDAKLANAIGLYADSEPIQHFVLFAFYLLKLKAISAKNQSIPLELLVLNKLGTYDDMNWLDQEPVLSVETEFFRLYPKAYIRLKNSLGEYPFFIKNVNLSPETKEVCYCVEGLTMIRNYAMTEEQCKAHDSNSWELSLIHI